MNLAGRLFTVLPLTQDLGIGLRRVIAMSIRVVTLVLDLGRVGRGGLNLFGGRVRAHISA